MVEIGKFMPKTEIVLLANDDLIVLENGFELKLVRGKEGNVSHLMLGATKIVKKDK